MIKWSGRGPSGALIRVAEEKLLGSGIPWNVKTLVPITSHGEQRRKVNMTVKIILILCVAYLEATSIVGVQCATVCSLFCMWLSFKLNLLSVPNSWNNGKEVLRLDLTSSTTPGQQIHYG